MLLTLALDQSQLKDQAALTPLALNGYEIGLALEPVCTLRSIKEVKHFLTLFLAPSVYELLYN